jgi:hypothetical protein
VILHLQEMDQLWLTTAALYDLVEVRLWLRDKLFDAVLVGKHAIFLVILEDTEVGLSWHEEPMVLHDVDKAETKEVKRDVHEVRSAVWHQTDYV